MACHSSVISAQFANIGAARNAGLERVAGEYVFFLDSDDEIVAGALTLLHQALKSNPSTGIAVGAFARRTSGRPDNLKLPSKYTDDCGENARRYLRNALRSIAIGSALFAIAAVRDIRFPTTNLDEDTCYWAAILTRLQVATIDDLVLIYNFDEGRMIGRFVSQPRATIAKSFAPIQQTSSFRHRPGCRATAQSMACPAHRQGAVEAATV